MSENSSTLTPQEAGAPSIEAEAINLLVQKQNTQNNGASWFFWISGLSLATSLISLAGGSWSFLAGLGATQLFDGIALGAVQNGWGPWIKGLSLFLDVLMASTFLVIGLFAKKRSTGAYFTGIALYALDTLIVLYFREWLGAAFHLFALIQIGNGLLACRWLKQQHD